MMQRLRYINRIVALSASRNTRKITDGYKSDYEQDQESFFVKILCCLVKSKQSLQFDEKNLIFPELSFHENSSLLFRIKTIIAI